MLIITITQYWLKSNGHLLSISLAEVAQEQTYEGVELPDLLLVVILQGVLVALLQSAKRVVHLRRPKDLSAGQSNLWHRVAKILLISSLPGLGSAGATPPLVCSGRSSQRQQKRLCEEDLFVKDRI